MDKIEIRPAAVGDASIIVNLIRELAEYEKLLPEMIATESDIKQNLFCDRPSVFSLIAEVGGVPVGFALYFLSFSTFLGRHGIYVEDLYVKPNFRGLKIGKLLLARVAQIAVEKKCGRMEGSVLDWNKPSIDFYLSIGAVPMEDWTIYRMTGEALTKFAASV